MTFTRLWLVLLSLVIGGLGVGGLALVRDADQESLRHRDERLTLSQQQIEQALRLDAAQLIETATVIGSDATLASTIEDAERGLGEPRLLQKSLQKRLRRLSDGKKLAFLWLLGRQGQVLARVGLDEDRSGDALDGWPFAELALRGYRLDDLYEQNGRIFTVAGVPLTALSQKGYAGALLIGEPLDEKLGEKLGLQAVWRHRDKLLGESSLRPPADARVVEIRRPGSVDGIALLTWQRAHVVSPFWRLRTLFLALPIGVLLRGAGLSALLLMVGFLLLRLDRSAPTPVPPGLAGLEPSQRSLLQVPTPPVDSFGEPGSLDALPRLYAEFVSTKVRQGESLLGLSFETFCDELRESHARIQVDQGCRDVLFRVHETDGRASLRATPVW